MKLSRSEIFEEIPVRQAVAKQVIPSIASQMVALAYNLADTYFVGKINDPNQTAAITIVYPAFLMLTALSNLFGVGGASLIARKLGSKEIDKAKQVSSFCFWSGTLTALLVVLFCAIFAEPILVLCGATIETLPIAYEYAKWVLLIGGIPTILNTMFANLVRSEGSAARASIGVTLGGILNIILDPFFVLPQFLGFGVAGAGMTTVISNTMATIYFLYYCQKNRKTTIIDINPKHLIFWKNHIKGVFSIGIPSALQYALTVVSVGAQSKFVSAYGSQAVAALGITKKLDQLPLYFSIGVSNGLLPLIGYNYAAKKT
jgi:MATE family, multidrug efflux pump